MHNRDAGVWLLESPVNALWPERKLECSVLRTWTKQLRYGVSELTITSKKAYRSLLHEVTAEAAERAAIEIPHPSTRVFSHRLSGPAPDSFYSAWMLPVPVPVCAPFA